MRNIACPTLMFTGRLVDAIFRIFVSMSFFAALTAAPKPTTKVVRADQILIDRFYYLYLGMHPSTGTWAGLHEYDHLLEDLRPHIIRQNVSSLKKILNECERFPSKSMSLRDRQNLELICYQTKAELLELEDVRMWQKNPDLYLGLVSGGIYDLATREFASPKKRLASVISREHKALTLLQAAKTNLKSTPKVFTQVAIQQIPDTVEFFKKVLPKAFDMVKDPGLQSEFLKTNGKLIDGLLDFQAFLEGTVLPTSTEFFALGADLFQKKLSIEEMVDVPLDQLLAIGQADLKRNRENLTRLAHRIDPEVGLFQVLEKASKDHPTADQLLESFQKRLIGTRQFIESHDLLTIPTQSMPMVREMPSHLRALTRARMETPGPFETKGIAYAFLTPPEPGWPSEKAESYLRYFSRGKVATLVVHESLPGHFVADSWLRQVPSKARKLGTSSCSIEGWAHYVEQMMIEEGFGKEDPMSQLGQIQEALMRDARYIVAIAMHTKGMSLEEAKDFFMREAFLTEPMAEMEAKRGAAEPMYLSYTLGKLQILSLREDLRRRQGSTFSLKAFHDRFLGCGVVPIRLVRAELLGEQGPDL